MTPLVSTTGIDITNGISRRRGTGVWTGYQVTIPSLVSSPPIFLCGGMKHIVVTFTRMKRWKKMTLCAEDKLTSSLPLTSHLERHHLRILKSQMLLGCYNQIVRNQILNEWLKRWINWINGNLYWILFYFSERGGKEDRDNKEGMFMKWLKNTPGGLQTKMAT